MLQWYFLRQRTEAKCASATPQDFVVWVRTCAPGSVTPHRRIRIPRIAHALNRIETTQKCHNSDNPLPSETRSTRSCSRKCTEAFREMVWMFKFTWKVIHENMLCRTPKIKRTIRRVNGRVTSIVDQWQVSTVAFAPSLSNLPREGAVLFFTPWFRSTIDAETLSLVFASFSSFGVHRSTDYESIFVFKCRVNIYGESGTKTSSNRLCATNVTTARLSPWMMYWILSQYSSQNYKIRWSEPTTFLTAEWIQKANLVKSWSSVLFLS